MRQRHDEDCLGAVGHASASVSVEQRDVARAVLRRAINGFEAALSPLVVAWAKEEWGDAQQHGDEAATRDKFGGDYVPRWARKCLALSCGTTSPIG